MTIASALEDLNNAILDIQQSDYNTYDRPIRKLALALNVPDLQAINEELKSKVDFEDFVERSNSGGSMLGSAQLDWPLEKELELGLTLQLIEKAGKDPEWLLSFSHEWYHDGHKIIAGIRKLTRSVLIPFARDYKAFLADKAPTVPLENRPSNKTKVFIVHGHDEGPRESVARFLEKLGLQPVILHEQASRGMTIPEKLIAHGDVGFAVVLLTPDDLGRVKTAAKDNPRARQNVILELGYFVGRLGRDKVCALLKGGIEIPSDYVGTVYINWDTGNAWKLELAKELRAAEYDVDFNKI
ncbi:nucleotide-binding protein [Roseinatronobacter sp. S2]|uniref:nucleotide-binding protein n=1 Tax=Roseinatronobacter sp. S2 TaxID=3035471 RepID=UPI00240F95E2|nr:nucleotide-binding protein [Roseinatronobacter sp. S2]WFE75900.1 nucleotide-binding protein [Roseinatronobacter sp. S2]